jgi:hypothetical protein
MGIEIPKAAVLPWARKENYDTKAKTSTGAPVQRPAWKESNDTKAKTSIDRLSLRPESQGRLDRFFYI